MSRPPIAPQVWQPPPAPPRARQRQSHPPLPPLHVMPLPGTGPEDVAVTDDGTLFTGVDDGRILRVRPDAGEVDVIADTGGRPLGVELLGDGLLVCDAFRGLLRIDVATGRVETLCSEAAGLPLMVCDNADVAQDGTIYFTDSSQRFTLDHWRADLLEHSGTGRLLRLAPDGSTDLVLDGLQFANGVALAPDESFVAVAETGGYVIRRVWLAGERAGTVDVLVDNLPGFPDNIATGSDGLIWIAIGSPRNPLLDRLHSWPPFVRRVVWRMPERLHPAPVRTVWVMAVDLEGRVVHDLQGTHPQMHLVTGAREHRGRVYLGNLVNDALAWFSTPGRQRDS